MEQRATFIGNIPFTIEQERVLREMRVSKISALDQLPEKPLAEAIRKAMDRAYTLIHGQGVFLTLPLDDDSLPDDLFTGEAMEKLLDGCQKATLLAVTIGPELETEVEKLDKAGEMTEAYALEMVGGLMADYMADRLDERIERQIKRDGFERTMRFSPGYGDWPLDRQPLLMGLVQGERIGISVTESSIMIPRKSVSAVIGWKVKG